MTLIVALGLSVFIASGAGNSVFAELEKAPISAATEDARQAATSLDLSFDAPVYSVFNLVVNATAVQDDGKVLVGGRFSIGGDIPHNGLVRLDVNGNIDPAFNNTGTGGQTQVVYAVAIQPDGKIIVAGSFVQMNGQAAHNVVRLNSDGTTDTSFDVGDGPNSTVRSIDIQSDGKILIAGDFQVFSGIGRNYVERLNANGGLDSSFDFGGNGPNFQVYAVRVQSNNKILIGGMFTNFNGDSANSYFIRLNSDGSLDTTFNRGTGVSFRVFSMVVSHDDRIAIGGFFSSYNGVPRTNIAVINADGSLNTSFNASVSGEVDAVSFQPDGKLVVGGNFNQVNGENRGAIARLNTNGTTDSGFTAGLDFRVASVFVGADGKLIVGGVFGLANGIARNAVARFDTNGSLDYTFDPIIGTPGSISSIDTTITGNVVIGGVFNSIRGVRNTYIGVLDNAGNPDMTFQTGAGPNNLVRSVALQSDGKVIAGGDFNNYDGTAQLSITRLRPDGRIDPSFILTGGIQVRVRAIKQQSDGKILVGGGFSVVGGVVRDHIARLNADGTLDTQFNARTDGDVYAILEQRDGRILIGGAFSHVNGVSKIGIARLNPDGTLDASFDTGNGVGGQVFTIDTQSDGKMVIGGFFTAVDNSVQNYVARLNSNGSLDKTFDTAGGAGATVFSVACLPDDSIIVGGDFFVFGGVVQKGIVRLNPNGMRDPSFSPVVSRTGSNQPTIQAVKVVLDPLDRRHGKIMMGGLFTDVDGYARIGLARFNIEFNMYKAPFDFDGDGKTDLSTFRPNGATGSEWWYQKSSDGSSYATQFGTATDKIVAADYTGDGKADIAFWRPSTGEWYILRSEDSSFYAFPFGATGDVSVPADFDGDGKADAAVFRPSTSTWYIQNSGGGTTITQFGAAGDQPVTGDFDGDGKADIAVFRPNGATGSEWWIQRSTAGLFVTQFGAATDKAVPGDYTGDGKADVAIWRPSTGEWFVLRSEDSSYYSFPYGTAGDLPVPGDYDGDGKTDAAVFRPSNSTWYVLGSTSGTIIQQFGAAGDVPVPNEFVH